MDEPVVTWYWDRKHCVPPFRWHVECRNVGTPDAYMYATVKCGKHGYNAVRFDSKLQSPDVWMAAMESLMQLVEIRYAQEQQ